jgi:hypothetical protein
MCTLFVRSTVQYQIEHSIFKSHTCTGLLGFSYLYISDQNTELSSGRKTYRGHAHVAVDSRPNKLTFWITH